jgi:glucose/arabinose dehydrogenase
VPYVRQDGGYLDVTVHPDYARTGWIYLSYSEVREGFTPPVDAPAAEPGRGRGRGPQVPSNTVVVRGRINQNREWVDQEIVFRAPAALYSTSGAHFGSRFAWDKTGHLFFSLGERGAFQNAQDLGNPLGKIHRVNDDGSAPADNPFVKTPGALPTIWSYGHRNPQGFAWDPVSGALWESEHGPNGGDEINVIEPGHNYGWGVVTMGTQQGITEREHAGMDPPVVFYTPSLGPSGMAFYTGTRYPGWKNTSLFVSGMVGERLMRLEISGRQVTDQEVVFDTFGRVRHIVQGPDGYLYVALQKSTGGASGLPLSASTAGMLVRLVPVP